MVATLVAVMLLPHVVVTVPSGQVGVSGSVSATVQSSIRISSEVRVFASFCLGTNCFCTV